MRIKLIALFIMMGSLAAVADNDTYFFSKVDYQQGLSNSAETKRRKQKSSPVKWV